MSTNPTFEKAVALARAGRIAEAVPLFARAVKAHPKDAVLRFNLANALRMTNQGKSAAQEYEACLKLDASLLDARMNLALLYNELGRPDLATGHAKAILSRIPLHAGAILALCVSAQQADQSDDLRPFLENIITPLLAAPEPPPGEARERHHFAIAGVCEILERPADAIAHFLRAPSLPLGLSLAVSQIAGVCDWNRQAEAVGMLQNQARQHPHLVSPFSLITCTDDPAQALHVAKAAAPRRAPLPRQRRDSVPQRRIRVGYLSADLRQHAVGFLLADMLEAHDRDRFDIVLYSYGPDDGSDMRRRLQSCGRFVDLRRTSNEDAAQLIARDKVDILVELTGYTAKNRMAISAPRPAKVMVNWLGYPGTLGSDAFDYIIADPVIIPPGDEQFFSEAAVRLPVTYQPAGARHAGAEAEAPDRPQAPRILAAFNGTTKITPRMFDIWCRLLHRFPDTILWLQTGSAPTRQSLLREALARGVGPERLAFADNAPQNAHLARYRHVDLQLDTFPYGGHTTTSDALLMGCPVLTLCGRAFQARVSSSLVAALDLPELVCHSPEEYEQRAIELLEDATRLPKLRQRILGRNAILADSRRFCRELESAYVTMMERWQAGLPPQAFDVPRV